MSDTEIYRNANLNVVSGGGTITAYVGGLAQITCSGVACAFAVVSSIPCREVIIQASSTTLYDTITVSLTSAVSSSAGLIVPAPTVSAVASAAGVQSPTLTLPINNVGHLWFYTNAVEKINVMWRN
jgi:hypothetical protein